MGISDQFSDDGFSEYRNTPLDIIKRRIDGIGVMIFTLDSGGTIQRLAKKFSIQPMTPKRNMPLRFTSKRSGGKRLAMDKGRITFAPQRERERPQSESSASNGSFRANLGGWGLH